MVQMLLVSAGFECSLDGGTFSKYTSPVTYENLEVGDHSVQVQAIDTSGNKDTTPATFNWKVLTPAEATTKLINTINNMDIRTTFKLQFTTVLDEVLKILNDNNLDNDKIIGCRMLDQPLLIRVNKLSEAWLYNPNPSRGDTTTSNCAKECFGL